jgi:phosphoglycerol transferase MdoB-like AlkP superfamily enzyme
MTLHTGIEPHPHRVILRDYTRVNVESVSKILSRHGYTTRFFSTGRAEWDNSSTWIWRWYDGLTHDPARQRDDVMYVEAGKWLQQQPADRPFFATVWTSVNHHPFDGRGVEGVVDASLPIEARYRASVRWADRELGRFLAASRDQPWRRRTVIVIVGDHGFPLGEHGSSRIGEALYGEASWVPLVFIGPHPELGQPRLDERTASHVDVAPTLLDLAGIDDSNSMTGHSLLKARQRENVVVGFLSPEISYTAGDWRLFVSQPGRTRLAGEEVFSTRNDDLDLKPGSPPAAEIAEMRQSAYDWFALMSWLYENDRIAPRR